MPFITEQNGSFLAIQLNLRGKEQKGAAEKVTPQRVGGKSGECQESEVRKG